MQISDDIQVVQGSLGSGKSMFAVMELAQQLQSGGVVACNFTLSPNWSDILASIDLKVIFGLRNKYDLSLSFWKRCFRIGTPQSMIELSGDKGRGLSSLCVGKLKGAREGKGLLIIDDCHHFFNSRTFTANKEYVRFFANARKYGWRTILITHDIENIDKQIRSYVEIETRFRNLQKIRIPIIGTALSPIPAFVVVRRYAGLGPGTGSKHSQDIYFFNRKIASLYDTLERFGEMDEPGSYFHQGESPENPSLPAPKKYCPSLVGQSEPWPQYYPKSP